MLVGSNVGSKDSDVIATATTRKDSNARHRSANVVETEPRLAPFLPSTYYRVLLLRTINYYFRIITMEPEMSTAGGESSSGGAPAQPPSMIPEEEGATAAAQRVVSEGGGGGVHSAEGPRGGSGKGRGGPGPTIVHRNVVTGELI